MDALNFIKILLAAGLVISAMALMPILLIFVFLDNIIETRKSNYLISIGFTKTRMEPPYDFVEIWVREDTVINREQISNTKLKELKKRYK